MEQPRPDIDDLLAHAESVRALALRLCSDAHAVDDGMQEVWLQALRRPPAHGGNLRGWLRRSLGNALRMRGRQDDRRQRREAAVARPGDATDLATAELAARAELHRELVRQVLRLPEPQNHGEGLLSRGRGRPAVSATSKQAAPALVPQHVRGEAACS